MRKLRNLQTLLDFNPIHAKTEKTVALLDELLTELGTKILQKVEADLTYRLKNPYTGAEGMSAEQVLRMALIKQMYGLSYRALMIRVEDSILLRRFAGYEFTLVPSHATLHENISRIEADTWEKINTALNKLATKRNLDDGKKVRIDTTGVETDIHHPTDASLLHDGIRVLCREMKKVLKRFPEIRFPYHDRTRASKKLYTKISLGKEQDRAGHYRRLVAYGEEVLGLTSGAVGALQSLPVAEDDEPVRKAFQENLVHVGDLLKRVIRQTRQRVFKGEKVDAQDKIVSIFEDHTDILQKGNRETIFGHKICLTIGAGTLIRDCQILEGNPMDASVFEDSLASYRSKYRQIPEAVATDKGFGSGENARIATELGVKELTFSQRKLSADAEELVAHGHMEKILMKFRAGAEAIISAAKRGVNLARCTWRGWEGFCAYVWSAIVSHNLKMTVAALM